MPGIAMDDPNENNTPHKNALINQSSPRSHVSSDQTHQSESIDLAMDGVLDTSIEQLYHNIYEMQSSDQSPSRTSYLSYGDESRVDSELRHLVGYSRHEERAEIIRTKEIALESKEIVNGNGNSNGTESMAKAAKTTTRPPIVKRYEKKVLAMKKQRKLQNGLDEEMDNGPLLLKKAREMISSGENPNKALELALQAMKSFEKFTDGKKPSLDLVMCLHVLAAIYCNLARYNEAIPILERSIEIPVIEDGQDHALAKFAGCMQLGDTYAMMGQIENSILFYTAGLEIQKQALGETDPRLGETYRYLAEANVQALQFDEAQKLCQMALDIHKENGSPSSVEEVADRRLMGLICDSKGDYETALEHYVLASMALASKGQELDVASIDCNVGDAYLALSRYDEAVFAYQKALNVFKSVKGDNHPAVGSVFVRLADLYNKIGKFRESKSYCENALRIFQKPNPGMISSEEIASGLIDVSAIYQSMNDQEPALKLLKKGLKILGTSVGQQSTIAGIEAQMGVMYYMMGKYSDSYNVIKSSVEKFRAIGEKKSALFGIALNQMGLVCVQRYSINEAADLFEEARNVLEMEYGPYHPDTLGVYSNLAGTYDAMGRLDDAIEILEYVVGMREEKLGTANPDVIDEKRRLEELLKEAGRARNRKSRSLVTLLDTNPEISKDHGIEVL